MKKIITVSLLLISILIGAQTTPGKHSIRNLDVNTKLADFGVAYFKNNEIVFASPSEKVTIIKRVWNENQQPFLDLYLGDIDSTGQIINKRPLKGDVNRKEHEAMVTFTNDYKTVYFSANNYSEKNKSIKSSKGFDNIQLYKASINALGEWTNIEKLPFNSDEFQSGLPTLSKDETKLYFVSDRPESIGKTDIYVVDIHKDGTYGEPENMGPRINTEEREMFPFISDDNILYFSSNGHEGYGRLDVFASKIFDNTVSEPINLGEPINSTRDDFAYILDGTLRKGYFASNRKEGKGDDDIYSFNQDEKVFIECLQTVKGVVRDKDTHELLPGSMVSILDSDGNQLQITAADEEDATYSFDVPCNSTYTLVGSNPKYLTEKIEVKTVNDIEQPAIEQNIDLATEFIMVGDELLVNIDVIYFDFDKSNIRKDAAEELDKVIDVMNRYPEMKIAASSYTDSRGPASYNMRLSDRRAKSSVKYIISKGIDAGRITGQGFGETQLVNDCGDGKKCSEAEHQLNRRTKFKVVEPIKVKKGEK
jgi:outer membrane protein OmpA-like peptidoglycan-associated protein